MTIISVIEPDFEFWQTGVDAGLPEAVWRSFGRVTGNASGGFMAQQIDFQKSTEPLSARLWSLEQIAASTSLAVGNLGVQATNLGEVLGAAPFAGTGFAITMNAVFGTEELPVGRDLAPLPWFLGAPRVKGVAAGLLIRTTNVNLLEMDIWLRGYVWGPRSQTVNGGPRRPVGSVFSR